MSIIDSGVRLRANDTTYSLAGNADLTDKEVIVYNDGNMGLETVATDHVLALPSHVKVGDTEKAFRNYVGESLGYGYWQGGNFGYIHQWDTVVNNPLLYQYPFSGAGTDLDFPVVYNFCESKVGDWWLGVGGWFEIVTPTWTDPSWDWVSSAYTLYTDKTKCSGVAYVYRVGATYYVRIWTLTDGVWGYVTKSGWTGLDIDMVGMWEWDGSIYYLTSLGEGDNFYINGVFIINLSSSGLPKVSILISDTYTYVRDKTRVFIFSKTNFIKKVDIAGTPTPSILIDADKCIVPWYSSYYHNWFFNYIVDTTNFGSWSGIIFPSSPNGCDGDEFNGGEDGKAISYKNDIVAGFDPVANTWTDYGRPWG